MYKGKTSVHLKLNINTFHLIHLFYPTVAITATLYMLYLTNQLLLQLKDQAVSLCDVVAPPDHILQSAIGSSDGQVTS